MRGFRKITIEEWADKQGKPEIKNEIVKMKECKCGQLYWSNEKGVHKKSQVHEAFTSQEISVDAVEYPREVDNPLDYGIPHPKPTVRK